MKNVDRGGLVSSRGPRKKRTPKVSDYLRDFTVDLLRQLEKDHERWGDTWLNRPKEGQEDRIFEDIKDYYDMYKHGGQPMPWLKIAGLALIGWIREKHPELSEHWRESK